MTMASVGAGGLGEWESSGAQVAMSLLSMLRQRAQIAAVYGFWGGVRDEMR